MQQTLDLLNEASEMVALSTLGNTKNLIITAAEIRGALDVEVLRRAVRAALDDFPQLMSCIREVRRNGRFLLAWEPRPDLEFPVNQWNVTSRDSTVPVLDTFLKTIEPSLDRKWNLFEELPGEFHVVSFSNDHHVAAPVVHHVAADAAVASEFGKFVTLKYLEFMTGIAPEFTPQTQSLSTSRKKRVQPKRHGWVDSVRSTINAVRAFTERHTLPVGHGRKGDPRQYHVKRMLSVGSYETGLRIVRACRNPPGRPHLGKRQSGR